MVEASGSRALQLSEVLCAEAKAIHNVDLVASAEAKDIYPQLAALNQAALCFSGGGIRSAAFCLGIVQAIAGASIRRDAAPESVEDTLLGQFHYLSTVSGGGYIGSWLSLWTRRDPHRFWQNLIRRPISPDIEPKQLEWLRANSNYLTPKLGATSADAWAGVALWVRNLSLNWLIILPVLIFVLFCIKWLLVGFAAIATMADLDWIHLPPVALTAVLSIFALRTELRNRPSAGISKLAQPAFITRVLAPALASAFLFALAVSTWSFFVIVRSWDRPRTLGVGAAFFAILYSVSWLLAGRFKQGLWDFLAWAIAGAIVGTLIGFAFFASNHTDDLTPLLFGMNLPAGKILIYFIYGLPAVLLAQMLGEMVFIGLTSYEPDSDGDREWFGRAAGWVLAAIVGWIAASLLSILAADYILQGHNASIMLATLLSGVVTGGLGKSRLSSAQGISLGLKRLTPTVILALAAIVFGAALVVGTSAGLDYLLLKHSLLESPLLGGDLGQYTPLPSQEVKWLVFGFFGNLFVGAVASYFININRFSLHALYRNRLIRAFLGATTEDREKTANPFTNFTTADNPVIASLWEEKTSWRPFHVINIALNIVSTKRLAWQERKAEPFTVTPLHSGSSCKAYRPSREYGGPDGITLGTAMAISGAAASPNMGYHSSPGISFLMALLNVR
ncbi:MAG: patatin-like phospholipase family protein, partial [Methylobacteriaceae bacterium]|nr:patatin-like phospholipase family protein [Methylobacteriaceae bacterium]